MRFFLIFFSRLLGGYGYFQGAQSLIRSEERHGWKRVRMYRLRIERGLIPGELSLALSHFRGAFVGCRRWIKSVKILSDALMEDLKTATRKNEILF